MSEVEREGLFDLFDEMGVNHGLRYDEDEGVLTGGGK
jgi:hypothetical protein